MTSGYLARWRGALYESAPSVVNRRLEFRIYHRADRGSDNQYVKVVLPEELDELLFVYRTCTWRDEPFLVVAEDGGEMLVEYSGGHTPVAEALDLTHSGAGVYRAWVPTTEVRDLTERSMRLLPVTAPEG